MGASGATGSKKRRRKARPTDDLLLFAGKTDGVGESAELCIRRTRPDPAFLLNYDNVEATEEEIREVIRTADPVHRRAGADYRISLQAEWYDETDEKTKRGYKAHTKFRLEPDPSAPHYPGGANGQPLAQRMETGLLTHLMGGFSALNQASNDRAESDRRRAQQEHEAAMARQGERSASERQENRDRFEADKERYRAESKDARERDREWLAAQLERDRAAHAANLAMLREQQKNDSKSNPAQMLITGMQLAIDMKGDEGGPMAQFAAKALDKISGQLDTADDDNIDDDDDDDDDGDTDNKKPATDADDEETEMRKMLVHQVNTLGRPALGAVLLDLLGQKKLKVGWMRGIVAGDWDEDLLTSINADRLAILKAAAQDALNAAGRARKKRKRAGRAAQSGDGADSGSGEGTGSPQAADAS